MSKLKSKLFGKFELEKNESKLIVGGTYTAAGQDTSMNAGNNWDVITETCVEGVGYQDVNNTGVATTTKDKPIN